MPRTRTGDCPIIFNADEETSTTPVRQADDGLHHARVAERLTLIGFELGIELFTSGENSLHLIQIHWIIMT